VEFLVTDTSLTETNSQPFGLDWKPHVSRVGGDVQFYARNNITREMIPLICMFATFSPNCKSRIKRGFKAMSKKELYERTLVNIYIYLMFFS
jgi:hypothetical protein